MQNMNNQILRKQYSPYLARFLFLVSLLVFQTGMSRDVSAKDGSLKPLEQETCGQRCRRLFEFFFPSRDQQALRLIGAHLQERNGEESQFHKVQRYTGAFEHLKTNAKLYRWRLKHRNKNRR